MKRPESPKDWHPRACCPACGWHAAVLDAEVPGAGACPNCRAAAAAEWPVRLMRWRGERRWWRPWTWRRRSHWETF